MFGFFRSRPPINAPDELATFIDENAAFLTQKGIYEYSRARAGHYSKVLFAERGFQEAVEQSRWRAYPLGLAMVAEIADGLLRARASETALTFGGMTELTLSIFDRYPAPKALDQEIWSTARLDLKRQLEFIGMHATKRAYDVCEPFAQTYFSLMPIHEKLRGQDFSTLRNYLRVTLCNIHDELSKRMDAPAMVSKLAHAEQAEQVLAT